MRKGCRWFALCRRAATTTRSHPILGQVPICKRCDDKVALIDHGFQRKRLGFIDVTPTWTGLMPVLAEAAVNGATALGRAEAKLALYDMARLADRWKAWGREGA